MAQDGWDRNAADALRLEHELREYHHKALWEEEKHFTWLHSIILAAQVGVVTTTAGEIENRAALLIGLAIVGFLFAVVALRVVRREGEFFAEANRAFFARYNALVPGRGMESPKAIANRDLFELPFIVLLGRPSIRDNFQFVFLVFGAIDVTLFIAIVRHAV